MKTYCSVQTMFSSIKEGVGLIKGDSQIRPRRGKCGRADEYPSIGVEECSGVSEVGKMAFSLFPYVPKSNANIFDLTMSLVFFWK